MSVHMYIYLCIQQINISIGQVTCKLRSISHPIISQAAHVSTITMNSRIFCMLVTICIAFNACQCAIMLPQIKTQTSQSQPMDNIDRIDNQSNIKMKAKQQTQIKMMKFGSVQLISELPQFALLNQVMSLEMRVSEVQIMKLLTQQKLVNSMYYTLCVSITALPTASAQFQVQVQGQRPTRQRVYKKLVKVDNSRVKQQIEWNHLGQFMIKIYVEELDQRDSIQNSVTITVVQSSSFTKQLDQLKQLPRVKPIGIAFSIQENNVIVSWAPQSNLTKTCFSHNHLKITQICFIVSGNEGQFTLPLHHFSQFQQGQVEVQIFHAMSKFNGAYFQNTSYSRSIKKTINIGRHHYMHTEQSMFRVTSDNGRLKLTGQLGRTFTMSGICREEINSKALLIHPNKTIFQVELEQIQQLTIMNKNSLTIAPNREFSTSFVLDQKGTYFLQINHEEGFAVLNIPIYVDSSIYPVIPDQVDQLTDTLFTRANNALSVDQILNEVNQIRREHGRQPVKLSNNLSSLALAHTQDMIDRDYISHLNPENQNAKSRAESFGLFTKIGENIIADQQFSLMQLKLNRSPLHLRNTLNPEWTQVGIGIARHPGTGLVYMTQQFTPDELIINQIYIRQVEQDVLDGLNDKLQGNLIVNVTISKVIHKIWRLSSTNELATNLKQTMLTQGLKSYSYLSISFSVGSNYRQQVIKNDKIRSFNRKNVAIATKYESGFIKNLLVFF